MSKLDAASVPAVRPHSLGAWCVLLRPRSLLVAISPVLAGAALGFARTGAIDLIATLLVLAGAVLVQVISNMQNDVGYTMRGGERSGTRTGLPRATAHGWLGVREVRVAIAIASLVAAAIGIALFAHRGWPVLAIGTASLLAALAYMGGPRPIAYSPLGEFTVFTVFGLVAVSGTDWVVTGSVGRATLVAGIAIGCLAAAALCVNNHRDIAHDRSVGRRTFAVTFGAAASRRLYAVLLCTAFALLPAMVPLAHDGVTPAVPRAAVGLLLPLALVPAALRLWRDFVRCAPGIAFNAILFRTFRLELAFAAMLAVGAMLDRLLR
jgi:1,4-dihydroxy-2-naphthoate octaprenyltransferase